MNCDLCTHTPDKMYAMSTTNTDNLPNLGVFQNDKIDESTDFNTNALSQRIWKSKKIYWKCESYYDETKISKKKIDEMISTSFLESSMHTPLIIQKRNKDTADAHIIINWLKVSEDSHFKNDESSLAYGYGPGSGIGGNVTMNADVLWLLRKTPLLAKEAKELGYIKAYADPNTVVKYYDPIHTMKHEGGHALGMDHITDIKYKSSSVMYPFYNGLRIFGKADIDYITSLYGKESVPESTKKTIRDRILKL